LGFAFLTGAADMDEGMAVDVVVEAGAVAPSETGSVDKVVNWLSFYIEGEPRSKYSFCAAFQ
jgi:hypothetical protein